MTFLLVFSNYYILEWAKLIMLKMPYYSYFCIIKFQVYTVLFKDYFTLFSCATFEKFSCRCP
uniref:Uncharacterized protein n=1 Tax=Arundo donax TaxID=35708 RepID=A0A0A9EGM4_ARUDO